MSDLAQRATVDAAREHGPIPWRDIQRAADRVRDVAVELVAGGFESASDAMSLALRLDATAAQEYRPDSRCTSSVTT
jgi:hypothetical protein